MALGEVLKITHTFAKWLPMVVSSCSLIPCLILLDRKEAKTGNPTNSEHRRRHKVSDPPPLPLLVLTAQTYSEGTGYDNSFEHGHFP